jgi:plastocyanin
MRRSFLHRSAAAALLTLAVFASAHAGQVRVDVGTGGFSFAPATITVNPGDQVVWIWASGGHTVTSGTDGSTNGSGVFRSGTSTLSPTAAYFWKVTGTTAVPYYCVPHFGFGMKGTININPAGTASVADFRITEVEFAGAGGQDRVQISNLGGDLSFLDLYRVTPSSTVTTLGTGIFLGAGSSLTLHLNASGTDDANNLYLPGVPDLGTAGSFAIYVPNTTTGPGGSLAPASLADANQMVDYVEWGIAGQAAQPNRTTAVTAGLWPTGDVVDITDLPAGGTGYSIAFCGSHTDHGASFWQKARPNFGGTLCTTAAHTSTWGRLKALYR